MVGEGVYPLTISCPDSGANDDNFMRLAKECLESMSEEAFQALLHIHGWIE
jgi:hypothetical protein